jgi:hypothetical protein
MRKLLAATALLGLMAVTPASAALLSISQLPNPVPQSQSNPCIICGTNQPGQPTGFGYNDFSTQGYTETLTLFSTNLNTTLGSGVQSAFGDNYTAGQLRDFFGTNFTFGVAVDVNAAGGKPPMTLDSFQLINLGAPGLGDESVIFETAGPITLQDIHNGQGKGDYLLSGFDLSGVNAGDRLVFRAVLSNMSDGPDSFYLVAEPNIAAVPELSTWALMCIGFAGLGFMAYRRRENIGGHAFRVA